MEERPTRQASQGFVTLAGCSIEADLMHPGSFPQVLGGEADTIDMIKTAFDLFVLFCIAFGVMFGIVFFPMFKHFLFS